MPDPRPNILFIMSDDHASHAMSCYGSRINRTPHLDRIAAGGMRFDNCFCTNSICTPSRAVILTGTYNHINGVTTLSSTLDGRQETMPKLLQAAGYQTAIMGKWHLGHGGVNDPTGFDYWNVLPGQGLYHDPEMIEMGTRKVFPGYVTDLITDFSLDWLRDARSGAPLLPHVPPQGAPSFMGAGRKARADVRGRGDPLPGDIQRRLQQPGGGRRRRRRCGSSGT